MIISAMPGGSGSAESRPHELITQEEYNRKLANGEINEETIYLIDDQESIDLSNKADLVGGKVAIDQIPDLEYAPKYNAETAYPADAYCVHKGALWVNTSGSTVTGVEPSTDYNVWNVNYSNENLLDNPWFTVNQRGASGDAWSGIYGVDRWSHSYAKYTINDDGTITLPLVGYTVQKTNITRANLYTVSCMLSDGSIFATELSSNYIPLFDGLKVVYAQSDNGIYFFSEGANNITVKAFKVERGPFSTLANDVAPDYATELAKCQRYFQRIDQYYLASGFASSTSSATIEFPYTLRKMDSFPTITGGENMYCINTNSFASGAISANARGQNFIRITFSGFSGLSTGSAVICEVQNPIFISADL